MPDAHAGSEVIFKVLRGCHTARVLGIIFLIDLAIAHLCNFSNTSEAKYLVFITSPFLELDLQISDFRQPDCYHPLLILDSQEHSGSCYDCAHLFLMSETYFIQLVHFPHVPLRFNMAG